MSGAEGLINVSVLDTPFPDHPALSISLSGHDAKLAEDRDGSVLDVVIQSKLPCVSDSSRESKSLLNRE